MLPAGYRADPLDDGDVDDVAALVRAWEQRDSGQAMDERAGMRVTRSFTHWASPLHPQGRGAPR